MLARNSLLARLASSAVCFASLSFSSACLRRVFRGKMAELPEESIGVLRRSQDALTRGEYHMSTQGRILVRLLFSSLFSWEWVGFRQEGTKPFRPERAHRRQLLRATRDEDPAGGPVHAHDTGLYGAGHRAGSRLAVRPARDGAQAPEAVIIWNLERKPGLGQSGCLSRKPSRSFSWTPRPVALKTSFVQKVAPSTLPLGGRIHSGASRGRHFRP